MPQWLCNQLMRAFHKKDSRQIKLLNECWFFYRNKPAANGTPRSAENEL
ncbi:cortex morphogenetic protein CmpA [Paenibacillus sp. 1781tsa1]|nr:cortex morphogenetic protein CmpA [Paenibacillus sp. 1781tsa1]MCP1182766.1 cortex morphogenetic protein CmpA [Paenibacillus sp. 1781tsa1]